VVQEEEIDKSRPWGFFDGASQNFVCGGGAILYLSDSHFFKMSLGLGEGSNNYEELMSLKFLLIFSIEKGCKEIRVFDDSMTVINWSRGTQRCLNLRLEIILEDVKLLQSTLDSFDCHHVYRERNEEADKRSKEGINLALGQWKITEIKDDSQTEYFHRPFIEGIPTQD
jgi:ribonuclease HI